MSEKTSLFHEIDHSVIGNISPDVAVTSWDNEKADYDYATDTCDPNSRFGCGHYTQVTIYINHIQKAMSISRLLGTIFRQKYKSGIQVINFLLINHRYMAERLPIQHKIQINQSVKQSIN